MMSVRTLALIAAVILVPVATLQTGSEPKQAHWWEIATGILAIPAAVVGLVYSYVLVKKTRLEVRKTELEIREKEAQLQSLSKPEREVAERIVAPLVRSQVWQYFVLRFILMYIVLGLWGLVEDVFSFLFRGTLATVQSVFHVNFEKPWIIIPLVLLQQTPKIGYWLLFFALGLPLFKDVNGVIGLRLRELFSFRRPKSDA